MFRIVPASMVIALALGAAPAFAQFTPLPSLPNPLAQPPAPPAPMFQPIAPMSPPQGFQQSYQPPAIAVTPQGSPMGVVVPYGGGNNMVVSPDGQPIGITQ